MCRLFLLCCIDLLIFAMMRHLWRFTQLLYDMSLCGIDLLKNVVLQNTGVGIYMLFEILDFPEELLLRSFNLVKTLALPSFSCWLRIFCISFCLVPR